MTDNSLFTRRRMLQLTGSAAIVGLAGCSGAQTNNPPEDTIPTDDEEQHDENEPEEPENGHDDEEDGHDDGEEDDHDDEEDGHDDGEEDDHDDDHDEAVGAPSDSAEVRMVSTDTGHHFEPHVVRVNVGGTVTFVNESGTHSATAYHPELDQPQLVPDGSPAWDSGILTEPGATFEHTFETEGVYHYYCIPHETVGMISSVIVGEPDPHEEIALEEPPADKPEAVQEVLTERNHMVNTALDHIHEED